MAESSRPGKRRPSISALDDISIKRPTSWNNLCQRCETVPWSSLAQEIIRSGSKGKLILRLSDMHDTHEELRRSECKTCQCLSMIKPSHLDGTRCELRAYSARHVFGRVSKKALLSESIDSVLIGIVPRGKLVAACFPSGFFAITDANQQNFDFGPRRTIPDTIDFELVKGWLRMCKETHVKTRKSTTRCRRNGNSRAQELQVIDCITRRIVPAPAGCTYVALSYIWGDSQASTYSQDTSNLPAVVQDSIRVTQSLEYRYLWVDRYAGGDKHVQIAQMDKIYSGASITIIAAAGNDAEYGLPGIGSRSRHTQAQITIGQATLTQIFPHTSESLLKSTWATRGWTFQEGYLSRRRLIFTDYQVSFLCNRMFAAESITQASQALNYYGIIPFRRVIPSSPGSVYSSIADLLAEYTARDLRYESDTMLAVLGMFRAIYPDRDKTNLHWENHLWGVPLSRKSLRLDWCHITPPKRRHGFPSWSWTGWKGEIEIPIHPNPKTHIYIPTSSVFAGRYMVILDDLDMSAISYAPPATAPTRLYVTGRILHLSFKSIVWPKNLNSRPTIFRSGEQYHKGRYDYSYRRVDGIHSPLQVTPEISAMVPIVMDDNALPEDGMLGIALDRTGGRYSIIILKQGKACYERVGVMYVQPYEDTLYNKNSVLYKQAISFIDSSGKNLEEFHIAYRRCYSHLWYEQSSEATVILG